MVVEQLKNEMMKTEEMRSCIDILNDILVTLTRNDVVSGLISLMSFRFFSLVVPKKEIELVIRAVVHECTDVEKQEMFTFSALRNVVSF